MITYEHPVNERVRTLLRLEDVFERMTHFMHMETAAEHHVALTSLFEIVDIARPDLKMDLMQELERQRQSLLTFRNNPDISEEALSGALYEIEQASAALLAMTGKIGQYLRDNEWLMNIKSRAAMPGGCCEFDLPAYYYWQHQTAAQRIQMLEGWVRPMQPLRSAVDIVLRLLRASGCPQDYSAARGQFQMSITNGIQPQMVRVNIPDGQATYPEISANRFSVNIRFLEAPDYVQRARLTDRDVNFSVTFCTL